MWQRARPEYCAYITTLFRVIGNQYPTGQAEASDPASLMTFARVVGGHMGELGCDLLAGEGIEHPFVEDGCTFAANTISVIETFLAAQHLRIAIG